MSDRGQVHAKMVFQLIYQEFSLQRENTENSCGCKEEWNRVTRMLEQAAIQFLPPATACICSMATQYELCGGSTKPS
jgi:hypothetical protein